MDHGCRRIDHGEDSRMDDGRCPRRTDRLPVLTGPVFTGTSPVFTEISRGGRNADRHRGDHYNGNDGVSS